MTVNMVTVTIEVDGSPADVAGPEGNYVFSPSGVMWPDTSGAPIAPMLQHGSLTTDNTAKTGTATVQLVASDNYSAGVLAWDVIVNVRDLPTVNVPNVPVNFAAGATQTLWSILAAAGWTPTTMP